jgi:hypothetical protein
MLRLASLAFGALFAAGCYADTVTIYFTGLPATYQNGSYNGYATAVVDGIPNQLLICDDYGGETYVPSPADMAYDFSTLTGNSPLEHAMWNSAAPASDVGTQKYDAAAVLLYDLSLAGPNASSATITDTQYALWNLMDPTAPYASGRSSQEQGLQTSALDEVTDPLKQSFLFAVVYPGLEIYTPTAQFATNQEFLQFAPGTVPEPSSGQLLAAIFVAALAAIYFSRRATRKRSDVSKATGSAGEI